MLAVELKQWGPELEERVKIFDPVCLKSGGRADRSTFPRNFPGGPSGRKPQTLRIFHFLKPEMKEIETAFQ
jgi:hypothetical protein